MTAPATATAPHAPPPAMPPCGGPAALDVNDPGVRRLALVAGLGAAVLALAGLGLAA